VAFQIFTRHFVAIACFACQILQHFFGNGRLAIGHKLVAFFDHEFQALFAIVDNLGERIEVGSFEYFFGLGPLQRTCPHLQLRIEIRYCIIKELFEHFCKRPAQV
jgi:hypothetical protein